ncbi:hypothetical protein GGR58DRAFT_309629 [Xylaria digitata]|nr:hypothetical protein GGR58DRAFT_309629 [Xylaria digitata]
MSDINSRFALERKPGTRYRGIEHHCESETQNCKCDLMPETEKSDLNSFQFVWFKEFENVASKLAFSVGVAALSDFKAANLRGKVRPSGSSGWMLSMFSRQCSRYCLFEKGLLISETGMQSTARAVSITDAQLLCPHCWVTGEPISHSPAARVQPLRLVGLSDKHDEYTVVSHLWSEFRGDETLRSMQNCAAMVGGPASLWIDTVCIN